MSASGLGCVKTRRRAIVIEEVIGPSLFSRSKRKRIQLRAQTEKYHSSSRFDFCVFTQPGSKPEVAASIGYVRSTPESGLHGRDGRRPLRARLGHQPRYSITSSARSRIEVGISMPIALAARRLTAVSNFVDCSTGTSSGFAPERTLSTM